MHNHNNEEKIKKIGGKGKGIKIAGTKQVNVMDVKSCLNGLEHTLII